MDFNEVITVAKLDTEDGKYYVLIGWQANSFEMYLFSENQLYIGKFSHNRLIGFSKHLQMTEDIYFSRVKKCLSEQTENYQYQMKNGFFYWKSKLNDTYVIEGFLPVEPDDSPLNTRPDLIEVLLTLNKHLRNKLHKVNSKFESIKTEYQKCIRDTESFLNLKIETEKVLCEKFLNSLKIDKPKTNPVERLEPKNQRKVTIKLVSRSGADADSSAQRVLHVLNNEKKWLSPIIKNQNNRAS